MRRIDAAWLCLWLLRERIAGFHATASVRMQYKPSCDVQMQARPGVHARVAPQSTKVATSSPVQYPHATSHGKQKVLGRSERFVRTATSRPRLETTGRGGLLSCGQAVSLAPRYSARTRVHRSSLDAHYEPAYAFGHLRCTRRHRCACCTSCTT